MKKLKRVLEVSSVLCSTASINMVIACLYGGVPKILGLKSQRMIFDFAFSLLVASVILGILAIVLSRIQDRKLEISFPALKISTIFSSILSALPCFKNKDAAVCKKISNPVNTRPVLNHEECIDNLKEKRGDQEYSNCLDNLSIKNSEDAEHSLQNAEKNTVFSASSDKSADIKNPPQLQKCPTPFFFGHRSMAQNPIRFTKSLKFLSLDLKQMEKKSQLAPLHQQTFVTNGYFNEVNTRNLHEKHPQVGIVSPIKIKNSNDIECYDLYTNLPPTAESIHTCQKRPKKTFNVSSSVQQQSFYQNTSRMSNACCKVDNSILYESNAPIKTYHNNPSSQRELFSNRLHTTYFQSLQEVQNKFHESREIPYTELLQTTSESSDEFSYKRSATGKFNFHEMQEVDSGDHCYKLHRKVTPSYKSFHHDNLRDFKQAPHSQMGTSNHHFGWNINSIEWGKNIVQRPDIPMEICDMPLNDQVLDVSMKLNDLNLVF